MTNKEIAKQFQYLGQIMELHLENPFKIRSYNSAYINLRKLSTPLSEMSEEEITSLKGVGKNIAAKIQELLETGTLETIKKYEVQTPEGVQEMLKVKGFGPKKIRAIWKDMGIETVGELLYACNENRLVELKGFGQKTQEQLRQQLEYFQQSQGKYRFADLEPIALKVLEFAKEKLPTAYVEWTGGLRRKNNEVDKVELIVGHDEDISKLIDNQFISSENTSENPIKAKTEDGHAIHIFHYKKAEFGSKQFRHSASAEFMDAFLKLNEGTDFRNMEKEAEVFEKAGLPYLEPELREQSWALDLAKNNEVPKLVEAEDIKGIVHAHSTYSDGIATLKEMADHARSLGYQYLGITDHSKAAFYANGLKEERLEEQWAEIDKLNEGYSDFKIFKGIESDILNDGSLDYEEDYLKQFDFIIASVHSNLRMDEEKANNRLLKAIENPYTTILGHPTGRLLLSRKGYPIDHLKIIDACATNGVAIELNANPYRLDLDWTWIPYALEKGVLISINPDAHSTGGMDDVRYGVFSARKGGLTAETCLTCFDVNAFETYISKRH